MYISSIRLRDWKAYRLADFDFPAPSPDGNIILIGAQNGYGKTSLFEAIVLGLFGREGLQLIARIPFSVDGKERLEISYKEFLEKALYKGATKEGRTCCSVALTFVGDYGETFEIQRFWHFNDKGKYRQNDEEIKIFEGLERKAVGPESSVSETAERLDWYRNYIAHTFLPHSLAAFFLFDGENVSTFAERDMAGQVKSGIEHLLGIPILRELAEDLGKYAQNRRREAPSGSDKKMDDLESERDDLERRRDEKRKRLEEIEPDLDKSKTKKDGLLRELMGFGTTSQTQRQKQIEDLGEYKRNVEDGEIKLEDMLAKDIALALSGPDLRRSLRMRLETETVRERWENGKNQGDDRLDPFLNAVYMGIGEIEPSLDRHQRDSVRETVRSAWEKLWFPPPENCAEDYLHPYLKDSDRSQVIGRLNEIEELTTSEIVGLLDLIAENKKGRNRLEEEIRRTEASAPHIEEKQKELKTLDDHIETLNREVGALKRELNTLENEIGQKNANLARLARQLDQAKPAMRRVKRALDVSSIVHEIVKKAVPSQIDAIAAAMTKAHKSMAHKKDLVERIHIDENCDVKLLDSQGKDVPRFDLSAGEKQIFTQSLISAVSSVSGRGFPMVVDTPLGRLDIKHRKSVLKHLVQRKHQVILLSTNTEVVGRRLQEIAPHVQKKYLIRFQGDENIGRSTVVHGYFDDEEVAA